MLCLYVPAAFRPGFAIKSGLWPANTPGILTAALLPDEFYQHGMWALPTLRDLHVEVNTVMAKSTVLQRVLLHRLHALPGLKDMGLPTPDAGSVEEMNQLAPWLGSLQVLAADATGAWHDRWCAPIIAAKESASTQVFKGVASLVETCVTGQFGGVSLKLMQNLLDQTQAPQPLQSFCEDFARAVEAYAKVTSAGSLADLTKLCEAMCLLAGVLGRWPSESDLSDDFKQCGFGGHGAPVFVRTAHQSLEAKWKAMAQTRVTAAITLANASRAKLDAMKVGSEADFREEMKAKGGTLSKEQAALGEALTKLKAGTSVDLSACLSEEAAAFLATAENQRVAGVEVHTRIFRFTCLYVALTLFRSAATGKPGEAGQKQQEKLCLVLKDICDMESPPGGEGWFGDVLSDMLQAVGMKDKASSPAAASAPSGQASAPSGQASAGAAGAKAGPKAGAAGRGKRKRV